MHSEQAALQAKVRELQDIVDRMPDQSELVEQIVIEGLVMDQKQHKAGLNRYAISVVKSESVFMLYVHQYNSINDTWTEFARRPVSALQLASCLIEAFPSIFVGLEVPF